MGICAGDRPLTRPATVVCRAGARTATPGAHLPSENATRAGAARSLCLRLLLWNGFEAPFIVYNVASDGIDAHNRAGLDARGGA